MPGDLHKLWRTRDPKGYHVEYGYSCMGYEIAGGIGVKLAAPEREVVRARRRRLVPDDAGRARHRRPGAAEAHGRPRRQPRLQLDRRASRARSGSQGFGTQYRFVDGDRSRARRRRRPAADAAARPRRERRVARRARPSASLRSTSCATRSPSARRPTASDVIVVEVDRYEGVPGYESWWDVPGRRGVRACRRSRLRGATTRRRAAPRGGSCDAAARERAVHLGRVGADGRPRRPDPARPDAARRCASSATPASSSALRATSATDPDAVLATLEPYGLELVGAFAPLRIADEEGFREDLDVPRADGRGARRDRRARAGRARRRRERDAAARRGPARRARARRRSPATSCARAAERVEQRAPSAPARPASTAAFHPHTATYIEEPEEVAALLDATDPELVKIAFDTGHCHRRRRRPGRVRARGPRDRIAHLHLKDVDPRVLARVRSQELTVEEAWEHGLFCRVRRPGAVDFAACSRRSTGFDGWAVVEQDRVAVQVDDLPAVRAVEERNLAVARAQRRQGQGQSGPTASGRPATALARAATPTATARRSSSRPGPGRRLARGTRRRTRASSATYASANSSR